MSTGLEIPLSDEVVLLMRILNECPLIPNEEDDELRKKGLAVRQQLSKCFANARNYFAEVDGSTVEALIKERESLNEEAERLQNKREDLQNEAGRCSANQAVLQSKLNDAKQKRNGFVPMNRLGATLKEIEFDKALENELQQEVSKAAQALSDNHFRILQLSEGDNVLHKELWKLGKREEFLAERIQQLQLPPEQRKPRTSIVWNAGGSTFGMQPS